jgi:hypothetical protein
MHEDDFDACNSDEEGIHEETSGINWVEYVEVEEGVIIAELTASNHFENQENVTISLVPTASPEDAAMNWTVYCSDYNEVAGTHLIDTCEGDLLSGGSDDEIDMCFDDGMYFPCDDLER